MKIVFNGIFGQPCQMPEKLFFCYIMASRRNGTLYIGVTSDLKKRVWQHKEGSGDGFTQNHQVKDLVYYEVFGTALLAIAREKQLKAGSRKKKIQLIEKSNPNWDDLYSALG